MKTKLIEKIQEKQKTFWPNGKKRTIYKLGFGGFAKLYNEKGELTTYLRFLEKRTVIYKVIKGGKNE